MSLDDFLKLVEKFTDDQYGVHGAELSRDDMYPTVEDLAAEAAERKDRMARAKQHQGSSHVDLSTAPMATIKESVHTCGNIVVGVFIVKIKNYGVKNNETKVDLTIYEEVVNKTHFGSNKMPRKIDVSKDMRFSECPWLKYFKDPTKGGYEIPIQTAAEIVKWCQAVSRLAAFL